MMSALSCYLSFTPCMCNHRQVGGNVKPLVYTRDNKLYLTNAAKMIDGHEKH